jgi:aryl-phospho-beta-D-glucosidase BglC (GH1 family)
MKINSLFGFLLLLMAISSCKKADGIEPLLNVNKGQISLSAEGGEGTLTIESNEKWSINNDASWVSLSQSTGGSGTFTVNVTAISGNGTGAERSVVLVINSSSGQARRVTVAQGALIYPSYNTTPIEADATGMGRNAFELAAKMGLGINIGNTLEAPGGENGWEGNTKGWNPMITEAYVSKLKQSGFNAVRLPCAWDMTHLIEDDKARIDPKWMARVKEVIGYCMNNDMYVLLNIHWDGGWLENNVTLAKKDSVNAKQKAFWEQIATAMRDFDERLMFASANEPNAENAEETEVLLAHHQTFVDAVRATGGRNVYRNLVIQGHTDFIDVEDFPTDPTPNRLMFEWHNYTPYAFTCLDKDVNWGNMLYYWGEGNYSSIEPERNATYGLEDEHTDGFDMIKAKFLDKGIPVLLGEYGAYRRGHSSNVPKDLDKHNASVDAWITFVTKQATSKGIVPFFWDTGGLFDRENNTIKDQRSLDALIAD